MRWMLGMCLCCVFVARAKSPPPVWTDSIKPIWYWLRAASYGDPLAAKRVGDYYLEGHSGVVIRGDKAVPWYRQSAQHGVAQSALALGRLYWYGEYGVPKRHDLALYWLYRGAVLEDKEAQLSWSLAIVQLEMAWKRQHPDHPRFSPIALIHAKALVPEPDANFKQGLLCQYLPSQKCAKQAQRWYWRAARLGYEPAKHQLKKKYYMLVPDGSC